jgi:PAS domain-containing protein
MDSTSDWHSEFPDSHEYVKSAIMEVWRPQMARPSGNLGHAYAREKCPGHHESAWRRVCHQHAFVDGAFALPPSQASLEQSISDGLVIFDQDLKLITSNKGAAKMLGFDSVEALLRCYPKLTDVMTPLSDDSDPQLILDMSMKMVRFFAYGSFKGFDYPLPIHAARLTLWLLARMQCR